LTFWHSSRLPDLPYNEPFCRDCATSEHVLPIVYGYPSGEMLTSLRTNDRPVCKLGGCMSTPESPAWHCTRCGREWGQDEMERKWSLEKKNPVEAFFCRLFGKQSGRPRILGLPYRFTALTSPKRTSAWRRRSGRPGRTGCRPGSAGAPPGCSKCGRCGPVSNRRCAPCRSC